LKKLVMLRPCRTTFNPGATSSLCPLFQPQTPSRAAGSFPGPKTVIHCNRVDACYWRDHGHRMIAGETRSPASFCAATVAFRRFVVRIGGQKVWYEGPKNSLPGDLVFSVSFQWLKLNS